MGELNINNNAIVNISGKTPKISETSFSFMQGLLKDLAGIDLDFSKRALLETRLSRRLRHLGLKTWEDYIALLRSQKGVPEKQYFINSLTTNKTSFFREKKHFSFLANQLIENKPNKSFNVWVAASSFGHEAYSIAFMLEDMKSRIGPFNYRILATDIDTSALKIADTGIYHKKDLHDSINFSMLKRYFLRGVGKNEDYFKVVDEVKNNIKFRRHNMCEYDCNVPMKFDVIFVRNVFIYFDKDTIASVSKKLFNHLKPGGFLFTGICETLPGPVIDSKVNCLENSIYQKLGELQPGVPKALPSVIPSVKVKPVEQLVSSVLIIDDSVVIQRLMSSILNKHARFSVFGVASNPYEAEELMIEKTPDIITLDVNMPRMTGIEYLDKVLPKRDIPVVMVSGASGSEGELALQALELGAIDFIEKPEMALIDEFELELGDKLLAALQAKKVSHGKQTAKKFTRNLYAKFSSERLIAIGASTGGTVALGKILQQMPKNSPGIVIVQHIPPYFSNLFAKRLDGLCEIEVVEASDGMKVRSGLAIIAPGDRHITLKKSRDGALVVSALKGPRRNKHIPSVDVLFESVADICGKNAIGLILTGMGKDGAEGLLKMKETGARTYAQNEESCVVYGMPKEAVRINAADHIISLDDCARALVESASGKQTS